MVILAAKKHTLFCFSWHFWGMFCFSYSKDKLSVDFGSIIVIFEHLFG